jgi:hypothetical protein
MSACKAAESREAPTRLVVALAEELEAALVVTAPVDVEVPAVAFMSALIFLAWNFLHSYSVTPAGTAGGREELIL